MNDDPIAPGEVKLWWTSVQESAPLVESLQSLLDEDELQRAVRFRVEAARRRFVTARAMLRLVLARSTGIPPEQLAFAFGKHGKPRLATGRPCFNLAHSGDTAVVAVAGEPVGVDVEELRALPNGRRLADRICTPTELDTLGSLPEAERDSALLRLWTCKEAVLKTLGSGIGGGMRSVEVDADPGRPPRLLRLQGKASPWSLLQAPLPAEVVCTVAVCSESSRLSTHPFPWLDLIAHN